MPTLSTFLAFALASAAIIAVPGPAVLYIVTRSIDQGRAAGLASVAGIETGCVVHVIAATVGLSAVLVSSAVAFTAVKFAGAAYLIIMGIRKLRSRDDAPAAVHLVPRPLSRLYRQGVVVNILNPKLALFFFAFLPQFVRPEQGHVAAQTLSLGCLFISIAIVLDSTWAFLASSFGCRLRASKHFERRQRLVTGGVFITLGATAALVGHHPARVKAA